LTRRSEFLLVYGEGIRVSGDRLVLFCRPSERGPRLGITATKKYGDSVRRNRARRLVREAYRRARPLFGPWDCVVNVRFGTRGAGLAEVETELRRLAAKARRRLAPAEARP